MSRDDAGFSLLEMAVVIAVIGILSVMVIPRHSGFATGNEQKMVQDMHMRLRAAARVYMTREQARPESFREFVGTGTIPREPETVTIGTFGVGEKRCNVNRNRIRCNKKVFPNLGAVTYTLNDGIITCNIGKAAC